MGGVANSYESSNMMPNMYGGADMMGGGPFGAYQQQQQFPPNYMMPYPPQVLLVGLVVSCFPGVCPDVRMAGLLKGVLCHAIVRNSYLSDHGPLDADGSCTVQFEIQISGAHHQPGGPHDWLQAGQGRNCCDGCGFCQD